MSRQINCNAEQRKIGQGCFYTASIESERGHLFTFAYDCGSNTGGDALEIEVDAFQHSIYDHGLDMLVISHLDADHVNGLDMLLKSVGKTQFAFLPYFNPIERLLCALRFPKEPENSYYEFLADPAAFLLSRGVETVVFIGPGSEGEEPSDQPPPENPPEYDEKRQPRLDPSQLPDDEATRQSLRDESPEHAGNNFILCKSDRQTMHLPFLWKFRFFHKEITLRAILDRLTRKQAPRGTGESEAQAIKAAAFLDAVEAAQPNTSFPFTTQTILQAIQDANTRRAIKDAYGRIASLHNDVSLVLWHGPIRYPAWTYHSRSLGEDALRREWLRARRPFGSRLLSDYGNVRTGTLLTGDLNLKSQRNKIAFIRHYEYSLPETAFFYLPHHGSHNNWKADNSVFGSESMCFVSAGLRNPHNHPHLDLLDDLDDHEFVTLWSHERQSVILKIMCLAV